MAVQAVLGALPAMPVPVVLDDQVVLVAVVDRTASLTASVEVLLRVPREGHPEATHCCKKATRAPAAMLNVATATRPTKDLLAGAGEQMNSNAAAPTVIAAETSGPRQTSTPTDPIPSGLQYITL